MSGKLLTTGEVAERLGVSTPTVWRWIQKGLIKAIQLPSGQYRVPYEEVERILHSKRLSEQGG